MSKPLLLSSGSGKVLEFVGTATGQLPTWSQSAQEWVLGTNGGSGGGGAIFYLNSATAAASPTGNVPGGSGGATAYFTPAQVSQTFTATAQTRLSPPTGNLPNGSYAIVQGFLSDAALGLTSIPAGLWDFNIWAQASSGAGPTQTQFRVKVGVYDGTNAPTIIATSDNVYIYDPTVAAQYLVSVVIPANTIAATDRLYIEIDAQANTTGRNATFYFGGNKPTHVHTTIPVLVNLATDVTGTLPVANGGTGVTTLTGYVKGNGSSDFSASATIPVADVTGAAPLASPTFTGTVTIPAGASISGFAPLASPTFTGTPAAPTASSGDNTTQIATTAFVKTAVAAATGTPYDVAGEYIGKPPVSTVLMRFVSNRSWTLKRTLVQASCTTFPTGSNAVATISIAGSNLTSGTITWATTSTVTVGSFTDTTIAAGQAVVLTLTTADSGTTFENPFFTLGGVVA